jgi:hypothetical protein
MTRIKFVDLPPFQDADTIAARLTATLKRLRLRAGAAPWPAATDPWEDEGDAFDQKPTVRAKPVSYDDTKTIKRRAAVLADRQAARAGILHLKKDELARLAPVLGGVPLAMAGTEHWADEIAADLHAAMPWMAPATEHVWLALRRAARRGGPVAFPPLMLNGPPGIGKSAWARRLARRLSLPSADIDASKGGAGFSLVGVERGWSTALPGRPVELILARRIANPVIIVDEVCKAGHATSTTGSRHAFADALLSLIEPATAAAWECPFFRLPFDLSHVLWVLTANDGRSVPAPLRSRCPVINLPDISAAQMAAFAETEGRKLGLSDAALGAILDALDRAPAMIGRRLSLRDVIRMLDRGEALEERPRVQ